MQTGDLTNNLRKLQKEIKRVKYEDTVDLTGLSKGVPAAFLPIYHYTFTSFSPFVAEKIADMDVELFGKSDLKFMEGVYRVLRDMFNYKPSITRDQFFSASFAERKVIMCAEVLHLIYQKHCTLRPQSLKEVTLSSSKMDPSSRSVSDTSLAKARSSRPGSTDTQLVNRADSSSSALPARKIGTQKHSARPKSAGPSARSAMTKSAERVVEKSRAPRGVTIREEPKSTRMVSSCYSPISTGSGIPKTPAIYKAASSAVEVVYVPRVATVNPMGSLDDSNLEPIVASSPFKSADPGRVVDVHAEMDDLTQIWIQTRTVQQSLELVDERLEKLEGIRHSPSAPVPPQKQDNIDTGNMVTLTNELSNKMETVLARLLLVENRVTMIETKLDTISVPNGSSIKIPISHNSVTERNGKTSACVESSVQTKSPLCRVAFPSPVTAAAPGGPLTPVTGLDHVTDELTESPVCADLNGIACAVIGTSTPAADGDVQFSSNFSYIG